MEIVDLLSYRYSEGFYFWGFVLVGQVIDLVSKGMVLRVVDLGFGLEVVDFVEESVGEDNLDMMEDIDSTEKIFHMDFSFLEPKVQIEIEIGAKVAAKNSSLVGADYSFDC